MDGKSSMISKALGSLIAQWPDFSEPSFLLEFFHEPIIDEIFGF